MAISLDCDCGKAIKASDALAGKRMQCPACGATVAVPAALPPPPVAGEVAGDDFEVLDDDTPLPEKSVRSPVKAVAVEEAADANPPEPAKKRKKKKKRRSGKDEETNEELYERLRASDARLKRTVRGIAFLAFGLAIVVGVVIAFTVYPQELKEVGGRAIVGMIFFGVLGLAAVGKGIVGLLFGQFLGEDDGP
jgi:hypothetical protein